MEEMVAGNGTMLNRNMKQMRRKKGKEILCLLISQLLCGSTLEQAYTHRNTEVFRKEKLNYRVFGHVMKLSISAAHMCSGWFLRQSIKACGGFSPMQILCTAVNMGNLHGKQKQWEPRKVDRGNAVWINRLPLSDILLLKHCVDFSSCWGSLQLLPI